MHISAIEKYFLFGLIAVVFILALMIFYPFITTIVLAGAFAVILTPIYLWIKKHITGGIAWLSSLVTVILFLIVLCVPIFFIGTVVFNQAENAYSALTGQGNNAAFVHKIDLAVNKLMPHGITFDTASKISGVGVFLSNNIGGFFASTFQSLLLFIVMILTIFYLLKDGARWKKNLITLLPLSEENVEEILSKLGSAINRILKSSFLLAITQGILVGIGLTIFGVPNGVLWGMMAGVASFVPTVGTSLVSVPAMIYLYVNGMHLQALGLLLWSILLVGVIDNTLVPYFVAKNTEIPSLFILFSILGGISLLGPVGVLIGPLVLSLLYSLISIYRKEIKAN